MVISKEKTFSIISAIDKNRGIGKNNGLPWHLSADLKHFSEITKGGTVIMGRKTWESLPEKYRPLPERSNIVVSRTELTLPEGTRLAHSLEEALKIAAHPLVETLHKTFVIGGATLYAEAIHHPACEELLLTEIEETFDCDAFFPDIAAEWKNTQSSPLQTEGSIHFSFKHYSRLIS